MESSVLLALLVFVSSLALVQSSPIPQGNENVTTGLNVSACDARSIISQHEGKRACVYKDTMGHPTVGIGYNLDNPGAPQAIAAVGANYNDVRSGKQCLTDAQIMQLFEPSYQSAVSGARRAVSCYDKLCCSVQNVMTDMDYNLGDSGFASFRGFIGYVCAGEWASAAADGKGTAWCGQVGNRCREDMAAVAAGCSGPGPNPPTPPAPTPPSPPPSGGCKACVTGGGGTGCLSECKQCGSKCTSCISGGGGKACASRCCDGGAVVGNGFTSQPKPKRSFRATKTLDLCNHSHESCCPAPGDDPNNCPAAARTSDCDAKKSCCCG